MNRRTIDPLTLSRRSYVPYTHVRRPQRVADRQLMYGKLQPANDNRDRTAAWFIIGALLIAAYFGLQCLRAVL